MGVVRRQRIDGRDHLGYPQSWLRKEWDDGGVDYYSLHTSGATTYRKEISQEQWEVLSANAEVRDVEGNSDYIGERDR